MSRLLGLSRRASAALVLGLGLTVAVQAQPTPRGGLDARLDRMAERLDLSAAQRTDLEALAARSGDVPDLWAVTADVHALLTPEQRAALTAPRADGDARVGRSGRGAQGRRGDGASRQRGDRAPRPDADRQADRDARAAQREAMQPIHEAARAERQRLREQLQSGALTDAAYADAVGALKEQTRAQVRAAATPEQRARLDAREAQRQAREMARDRVLSLTDAQKQQLDALRAGRVRQAERGQDLRPYLDEDGRLDRDALREARRAQQPQREAARQAAQAQRDEILTERQQELLAVHRALAGRQGRGHRGGGRGHRGGGRRG